MTDTTIVCPECGSTNISKTGHTVRGRKKVQKYRCNNVNCLRIFTEPKTEGGQDNSQPAGNR